MPKIADSSRKKDTENSVSERNNAEGRRTCALTIRAEENVTETNGHSGTYILGLCGTENESDFRIAATLSDYSCVVYSAGDRLDRIMKLDHSASPIVGTKFSSCSKHILYTATHDGIITACDLRAKGKIIATIRDCTPDGKLRPFASFEISKDDRLVVAGSEHVGGDAFILFWDLRYNSGRTEGKSNLLGGYWESHMDDVTTLAFHPQERDILGSGSTDGLINVFNLTKSNEDSALQYSLNTESSVVDYRSSIRIVIANKPVIGRMRPAQGAGRKRYIVFSETKTLDSEIGDRLGWLNNGNVWCTTHTHGLQLWDCEDAEPYAKFNRNAIGSFTSGEDTCYVVRMHNTKIFGHPFLLTGSTSAKGKLSGLCIANGNLEMAYSFTGNKQLVRDSWYNEKSDCLITGGEMGILNMWKRSESSPLSAVAQAEYKSGGKARDKERRAKPY